METILIATDFTEAAVNATRYGFEIAKTMKAKVILFTSFNHFTTYSTLAAYATIDEIEQISNQKLLETALVFNALKTVEVETQCRQGNVTDSIIKVAAENNATFIVVGRKEDKEIRKFFGSTVTSLIHLSTIPLIVVPEKAVTTLPKKIVLGSDLYNETSIDIVKPLKRIVEMFNARLSIVQVVDKYFNEPVEVLMRCSKPDWFLKEVNPDYEFLQDNNAGKSINDFVDENSIDMLAIIAHHHTMFERIFNNSTTKYFSFHTHVPLLILPSVVVNKTKTDKEAFYYCSGKCLSDNNSIPQCDKYHRMKSEYEQEVSK